MNDKFFPEVIDNSMRKELVKCQTAAKYKYEMGLRSNAAAKVDLVAGKAFAKGMEVLRRAHYGQGVSSFDALQQAIPAVYTAYGDFVTPATSNKSAARMAGAIAYLVSQRPLEDERIVPLNFADDGTLAVEQTFQFPLPIEHPYTGKPLAYGGRFDMLGLDLDTDEVWVVDEKTTSQMGEKWANQWALDSQMTGYTMGARVLLDSHGMGHPVAGCIINGVAIRLRDYDHIQYKAYRQDWEVDRWFKQAVRDIKRWVEAARANDHDMALDHACAFYNNPCEFAPMCKSANPERLIDGSYRVEWWNPLDTSN